VIRSLSGAADGLERGGADRRKLASVAPNVLSYSSQMPRVVTLLASLVLSSCASSQCAPRGNIASQSGDAAAPATPSAIASGAPSSSSGSSSGPSSGAPANARAPEAVAAAKEAKHEPSPREIYVAWLKERLPPGGAIVDGAGDSPVQVIHTAAKDDTPYTIAKAYLDLSDVYFVDDFATEIAKRARKANVAIRAGAKVPIPHLLAEPYKSPDDARIAPPEDKAIRGLYIRGATAVRPMFLFILDQMAKRDINAIVLDAKDYDGPVTYASKIPLVLETGAAKGAPIRDLARVIRFVHAKGIRVIMRVSCFDDEFMAKAKPKLSVQSKWGKPYPLGWLDPSNEGAQSYILDLVKESLDAGADEIQLDYVRFPVLGTGGADFHLEERNLTRIGVIRDFVKRAHAITQAKKVPLSLDVFGVIAQGRRIDIDALGQDIPVLAPECEALSPMVYPSHYSKGFYGWENPGDHPEIVGIGVKGSIDQMATASKDRPLAHIRPWIQAMDYKTTTYGTKYLQDEIRAGNANGAVGWLMWNPSQEYGYAWAAVPPKRNATAASPQQQQPQPQPQDTKLVDTKGTR
jgi:hypothetical protein